MDDAAWIDRPASGDAREGIGLLKHLQHAPGRTTILVGILEKVTDEFGKVTWQSQVEGGTGRRLRRGLKLWTVAVPTWKADLYRRLWLGRSDAELWPPGWVHRPHAIEVGWVKQLVAEKLRTTKDRRGFARREWAKLRERNKALSCAVLARAALWLPGADRCGDRFWQ